MQLFNNAEGGSNGVALTQGSGGNTGGTSGDFFDTITKGADGVIEFTNVRVGDSALAIRCSVLTTATAVLFGWHSQQDDTEEDHGEFLFNFDLPAVSTPFMRVRDAPGTNPICTLSLQVSGKIRIVDSAGATNYDSITTFTANTWYRIAYHYRRNAFMRIWVFNAATGALIESLTASLATTAFFAGQIHWGVIANTANNPAGGFLYFDQISIQIPVLARPARRMPMAV